MVRLKTRVLLHLCLCPDRCGPAGAVAARAAPVSERTIPMPRIPFIAARFPDKTESKDDIEIRLSRHLRALRVRKAEDQADDPISDTPDEDGSDGWRSPTDLGEDDRRRIRRRATALIARREAASGLGHLRKEEREQLSVLREGLRLVSIPSEYRADELAAEFHAEMPWMGWLAPLGKGLHMERHGRRDKNHYSRHLKSRHPWRPPNRAYSCQ
ncbi:hypothetical protein OEZ60_13240 [Defluviimonas sp. WL0024]|uniref:Uncharacterized protein n=1 Tax=Albidovulum salinarum TaxID=2984153 RepID=A0ABT2X4W3_9RHOB|nr:hypothetical protein [Defluviimonas sp. WL0024]MCU9848968.1 hypothetical protein [Defluviimonas sp. WL0024]